MYRLNYRWPTPRKRGYELWETKVPTPLETIWQGDESQQNLVSPHGTEATMSTGQQGEGAATGKTEQENPKSLSAKLETTISQMRALFISLAPLPRHA